MKQVSRWILSAVAVGCLAVPALAVPGGLDKGFSNDGSVRFHLAGAGESTYTIGLQAGGDVVVGASTDGDFCVTRFFSDGKRDVDFGNNGLARASFGTSDNARDLVVQPDGKMVVVGSVYTETFDIGVARFKANGKLDKDFGNDGRVVKGFDPTSADHAYGVALQDDGKIVVAAESNVVGSGDTRFVALRYKRNGKPDNSFSGDGAAHADFPGPGNASVNDLVVRNTGLIVLAGAAPDNGDGDFAMVRFKPNGKRDTSFGIDGFTTTDFGSNSDEITGIGIQNNGKIIAGGYSNNADPVFALARYTPGGEIDPSFRSGGTVKTDLGPASLRGSSLQIQLDDKILLGGKVEDTAEDWAIARYTKKGGLDKTFKGDGIVTTNFEADDSITDISFGGRKKLYAAGQTSDGEDGLLARYKTGL